MQILRIKQFAYLLWQSVMNKLTAMVLRLLLFGQNFQITTTDLFQLDDLQIQATEHIHESGDSVLEFISLHYGNQKVAHHQEHSQHKNLPFQQEIDVLSTATFYIQEVNLVSRNSIFQNLKKSSFFYQVFSSIFESRTLFEPPIIL